MTERSESERAELVALADLIKYVERNECTHEETHRGGSIWTICNECGRKWADDRGGFVPYKDPPELVRAKSALRRLAAQDQKPVAAAGWDQALQKKLNSLRLSAFETGSDAVKAMYFEALSLAFQRGELVPLRHNAPPDSGAGKSDDINEATRYAERLAVALSEKHYKTEADQWRPLSGDLIGLLTQIDNMTTGLARVPDHGGADAGVGEDQGPLVECPACRNWMIDRACRYCADSGEVTEQRSRDFGVEP